MKHLSLLCSAMLLIASTSISASEDTHPMVILHTNYGDIAIKVFEDKAPETVANFLKYVEEDFYDGTVFHRVIPGFVIQGGGYTQDYEKATGGRPPIKNESGNGLKNERGTLSMARTPDPDSATSQFFINLADNVPLNYHHNQPGYTVFGEVVDGMDVVDRIALIPTGSVSPLLQNVPQETVVIESAEVLSE